MLKSGQDPGECFSHPVGSCNSDQVFTSIIFWQYGVGTSGRETNQMVVNWKEKAAVYTTNIPDSRLSPSGPMTNFFWVDIGDFWVDATGHYGCYMDVNGNWIKVPGADTSKPAKVMPGVSSGSGFRSAGGITAIYDLKGARMGRYDSRAPARLRRGGYVVIDHAGLRKALIVQSGESRR
jgi:hypothetical protein